MQNKWNLCFIKLCTIVFVNGNSGSLNLRLSVIIKIVTSKINKYYLVTFRHIIMVLNYVDEHRYRKAISTFPVLLP